MSAATYRNYLLGVLLTIYAFNGVDGLALGLVLQNIKTDLHLSDTQLGLLSGIAFAMFYAVMGIPIARWADRGNRVTIIALTAIVWSVMVALCGSARTFLELMLIRIGVAVGEAGCIPPAQSLIADYFDRTERPRAVAIYMLGGCASTVIGYFVAGWLNESYGWRTMFMTLGLPGLILGTLAWCTLREPRREKPAELASARPSLTEVWVTLWTKTTFRHLLFCFSVLQFFAYGILQWQPAFFIRSYGLGTGELGTWFAAIYGLGGLIGTYAGGELASRFAANNERLQLRVMALTYCCAGAFSALTYLSTNRYEGFVLTTLSAVAVAMASGPLFATIQTLVPEQMCAIAIAILYLFANLIGIGLGPVATGALSDVLRPSLGEESLRYSLLALSPGYLWGGWHIWQASKTVMRDL
jgi:MFS family permease